MLRVNPYLYLSLYCVHTIVKRARLVRSSDIKQHITFYAFDS